MQDALNKFDPMPVAFGPVKRQAPKPTAAELRVKELRDFETMTDLPEVRFVDINFDTAILGSDSSFAELYKQFIQQTERELAMRARFRFWPKFSAGSLWR